MSTSASHRFVISAPFGNYVQPDGAWATLGTFTALNRPGRLWRILKTVRYYPRLKAWVNKIGLRNPGVDWLVAKVAAGDVDVSQRFVSIHGFEEAEWWRLLEAVAPLAPRAIELNMSCPNVGEIHWPERLFQRAAETGVPIVTKLPPVRYELLFEQSMDAGIRHYHACNTLPVDAGGLSGRPLKPVSLQCIQRLQDLAGSDAQALRLIGGGGIRDVADVDDYAAAGVHAVAVGTKVMNPRYLISTGGVDAIRTRAEQALADRPPLWDAPAASSTDR